MAASNMTKELLIDGYSVTVTFADETVEETYNRVRQILMASSLKKAG